MKKFLSVLIILAALSCNNNPAPSQSNLGVITAYVHWEGQGLANRQVLLVGTADTLRTDSSGRASFTVPAGRYVIRAFGINRGGPGYRTLDFNIECMPTDTAVVDIVDCLPCV